jgi:riboflavin kinase/FMN adenylyltransferase
VVGADFQFGRGRSGNVTVLSYMGEMEGFGVTEFEPVAAKGHEKISSTRIRDALKTGRPEEAAQLLGHWWTVESRVEHGDARGRSLGFPTANMHLVDCLKPAFGVYAVRAMIMENDKPVARHDGVANFGVRPMPMFRTDEPLLETFLFDYSGDLYGKHLAVELITYLRPEASLDGVEALKVQIAKDCEAARTALATAPAKPV